MVFGMQADWSSFKDSRSNWMWKLCISFVVRIRHGFLGVELREKCYVNAQLWQHMDCEWGWLAGDHSPGISGRVRECQSSWRKVGKSERRL